MKQNEEEIDIKNQPLSEGVDFNNPSFVFVPKETHEWRQKGYFLECRSCEITHGTYIGPNKLLIGIRPDGTPIFKNRFKK